eukprot:1158939-Pelagomonas_calceolata.AAC.3
MMPGPLQTCTRPQEDYTNHRYVYCVPEADIAIMPTLDYYGYEHEDAINGFVAEFDGQPGNR